MFEHRTRMAETSSLVQRALHSQPRPIQHVCINHRGADVLMSEQFLHGANVIAILEQMRGE